MRSLASHAIFRTASTVAIVGSLLVAQGCGATARQKEERALADLVEHSVSRGVIAVTPGGDDLRNLDVDFDDDAGGQRLKEMRNAELVVWRFVDDRPDFGGWRIVGTYQLSGGKAVTFCGNLWPGTPN